MTARVAAHAPLRVRSARLKDLAEILAIEAASFATDRFTPRSLRRAVVSGKGETLTAIRDGAVVGYAIIHFREGALRARLYSLAVSPEARGGGVGAALIAAVKRRARTRGRRVLSLEARVDNQAAIALYVRAGFIPAQIIKNYYADGSAALRMECRLTVRGKGPKVP